MTVRTCRNTGVALCLLANFFFCPQAAGEPGLNEGVALLESYDYEGAFKVFQRLARKYPDWDVAHVNKGLAALNLQGEYLQVAEESFGRALELNPRSLHALVTRGILHHHLNRGDAMLADFQAAVELDPSDPHALYYLGVGHLQKGHLEKARIAFERVVQLQPSFASAYYRLREAFIKSKTFTKALEAVKEFKRLEDAKSGVKVGVKYGEGGKYNIAIRDSVPPGWKGKLPAWKPAASPDLEERMTIGSRAAAVRSRPDGRSLSPAMAAGDLTGDGVLELVLCAEKGEEPGSLPGVGIYTRENSGYRLRERIAVEADVCTLGDVDGDTHLDLVLAGAGWLRLFFNDGTGQLKERKVEGLGSSFSGVPLRLYAVDADSDWDLDLVCLRQEESAGGKVVSRLDILNNNRDGTFRDISEECGVGPFEFPVAELLVGDFDGDVDADFLLFDGNSGKLLAFANERVWRYQAVGKEEESRALAPRAPGLCSVTCGDFDGDGREDLVLFCDETLHFWKNTGGLTFQNDENFERRFGALGGTSGVLCDFLGACSSSLLVLDAFIDRAAASEKVTRGAMFFPTPDANEAIPLLRPGKVAPGTGLSALATVFSPQPRASAELVVYDTSLGAGSYSYNVPGGWMVVDLAGPESPVPDKEHANVGGVGAQVEVRVGTHSGVFRVPTCGGTARGPSRLHFGLAGVGSADYLRILWPDAVLQSERSLVGGQRHRIREIERKPSSCPILFAWTGETYEFVGDFLGVGGLGFLELPGIYLKPDPTEYISLPALRALDGHYQLEVLEPLEECTYLDTLQLTVVDHPADVNVIPKEMLAVRGPTPDFELLAFRRRYFPLVAWDSTRNDITSELLRVDRRYGNKIERDRRFPGRTKETHVIELDFGDRIAELLAAALEGGGSPRPYLFLHGFVEYGYSTSNFAAWQAEAVFHAPSVRVERDGTWVPLREEWGIPAGYPRYMAVDLQGLLEPGDRRIRIDTNMEIYWDQAFLAEVNAGDSVVVRHLEPDRALLEFRGYPAEESPDGSVPRLYVYRDFAEWISFKEFPGAYTRYGDVRELLCKSDDRFVIFGSGDGLRVEFREDRLPKLRSGWRRTFLARTGGYCKDMDLYTAHPDRVEPLPFADMSGYPYGPEERYPATHDEYRRVWNTRSVEKASHGLPSVSRSGEEGRFSRLNADG